MSQALDLALSICSGSIHTDNIVHDWNKPLVVGSPTIGEIGVFAWNPILHRVEITAASQSQQDSISIISIDSFGALLINDVPIASQSNLAAAVAAATAAASSAASSAASASSTLVQINTASVEIGAMINQFQLDYATALTTMQGQVALAQQSASNAAASATGIDAQVALAQAAAGASQSSAAEAAARAGANSGVTFPDGSKSAATYADLARQNSQLSRAAVTRSLIAANFPETFQPASLYKRARVTGGGARVVTVPQGIWPVGGGEAWATYRLEEAGSLQIVKQAGNTTGEVIPTLPTHMVGRARYASLLPSVTITRVFTVPAVTAGKLVVLASAGWATVTAVTMTCSFDNGLITVTRLAPRTPPLANQNVHFAIFDAALASFAGGDVSISVTAGPDANLQIVAAFVISGQGAAVPIAAKSETATSGSSAQCTLTAVPASSIILALGVQRGLGAFTSFSNNLTVLATGNMLAVPTASDTDVVKNASWGYGVGVAPSAGDVIAQANFQSAVGGPGIAAISYPPGVGAVQPLVNMVYEGGRDTLNVVGQEAVLNFVPDGRTVFVSVPNEV